MGMEGEKIDAAFQFDIVFAIERSLIIRAIELIKRAWSVAFRVLTDCRHCESISRQRYEQWVGAYEYQWDFR